MREIFEVHDGKRGRYYLTKKDALAAHRGIVGSAVYRCDAPDLPAGKLLIALLNGDAQVIRQALVAGELPARQAERIERVDALILKSATRSPVDVDKRAEIVIECDVSVERAGDFMELFDRFIGRSVTIVDLSELEREGLPRS